MKEEINEIYIKNKFEIEVLENTIDNSAIINSVIREQNKIIENLNEELEIIYSFVDMASDEVYYRILELSSRILEVNNIDKHSTFLKVLYEIATESFGY